MHYASSPAWSFPGRYSNSAKTLSPGPGQYCPSSLKFENSPKYRIGSSKRSNFASPYSPGPGTYNPQVGKIGSSPGYSCSKGTRSFERKDFSPGPGTYNARSFLMTVGGKIGTSDRKSWENTTKTPGPGAYLIGSKIVEGPKFSIVGRRPDSARSAGPGPGSYLVEFNGTTCKENSPCFRIGSAERASLNRSVMSPGPGRYQLSSTLQGPKWVFGTSGKSLNEKLIKSGGLNVPGPGSYSTGRSWLGQGYTIQGRYQPSSTFKSPGPGSYSPSAANKEKASAWSMGRAVRGAINGRQASPGPGAYSETNTLSKTLGVFSRAARSAFPSSRINGPGPGQYLCQSLDRAPAYSIRGRTASGTRDNVPGPGQYSQSYSSKSFSNGWTFTREKRGKDLQAFGPGPGSYSLLSSIGNIPSYARVR